MRHEDPLSIYDILSYFQVDQNLHQKTVDIIHHISRTLPQGMNSSRDLETLLKIYRDQMIPPQMYRGVNSPLNPAGTHFALDPNVGVSWGLRYAEESGSTIQTPTLVVVNLEKMAEKIKELKLPHLPIAMYVRQPGENLLAPGGLHTWG